MNIKEEILRNHNISHQEVKKYFKYEAEFSDIDLSKLSFLLQCQLVACEKYGSIYPPEVGITIRSLQKDLQNKGVKKPSEFLHKPLEGYKKAHFYSSTFMMGNILNYWESKPTDPLEEYFNKTSNLSAEEMINNLIEIPIKERSERNKLTGEWIIYKEYQNHKYFLTLGKHTETNDEIHKRIINYCKFEFPFID